MEELNFKHETLVGIPKSIRDMSQKDKDILCDSIIKGTGPKSIKLDMIYSHSGKTINRRIYSIKGHQSVADGLAAPDFPKPVTLNHEDKVENIIGRFKSAKYVSMEDEAIRYFNKRRLSLNKLNDLMKASSELDYEKMAKMFKDTKVLQDPSWKGLGRVEASLNVTDAEAMVKFINGTWFNFSAEQMIDAYVCSECLQDWRQKGMCDHYPGQIVDGRQVVMLCGDSEGIASSVVVQPADRSSRVTNISLSDSQEDIYEIINKFLDTNETEGIITMDDVTKDSTPEVENTLVDLSKLKDNEIEQILLPLVSDKFIKPLEDQITALKEEVTQKDSLIATKDAEIVSEKSKTDSLKTADAIAYKLVNDKLQVTLAGFTALNDKANLLLDSLKPIVSILGATEEISTLDKLIKFVSEIEIEKLKKKIDHGMTNPQVQSVVDSPVVENSGQDPILSDNVNEKYKKYIDRYNYILDTSGELAAKQYVAVLKDKKFIPDTLTFE